MLNDTSTLPVAAIPAAAPDRGFGRFAMGWRTGSSLWRLVDRVRTVVLVATLQFAVWRYGVAARPFSYLAAWSSWVILCGAAAWRRLKQLEVRRFQTLEGTPCNP